MDFSAYIYQNNSNKKKFEQLKEPFLKKFRFTFREKKKFQKNLTLFNTGFNSHLILKTLHFPPREDNLYMRSEEHTSELQSRGHLVCRLLLEKKKESKRSSVIEK